jgi:hypothetical protein
MTIPANNHRPIKATTKRTILAMTYATRYTHVTMKFTIALWIISFLPYEPANNFTDSKKVAIN